MSRPSLAALVENALRNKPTRFDRPIAEVLAEYQYEAEELPPIIVGTPLGEADSCPILPMSPTARQQAVPIWCWLRRNVRPVLESLAADKSARAKLVAALPAPVAPPKPVPSGTKARHPVTGELVETLRRDGTASRRHRDAFSTPAVFLWLLWHHWTQIVGGADIPKAPRYPGLAKWGKGRGKTKTDAMCFLSLLHARHVHGPFSMAPKALLLSADEALRWLSRDVATTDVAAVKAEPSRETLPAALANLSTTPQDRCSLMTKTEIAARILNRRTAKAVRPRKIAQKLAKCGLKDEGNGNWSIRLDVPDTLSADEIERLRMPQWPPPPKVG
jgi:hypothetical protein